MDYARNAPERGQDVSLRLLACGWVLALCVAAAMWLGGSGAGVALLTAGALSLTLSKLCEGTRRTVLRMVAGTLALSAVWLLWQELAIFA